ncbi:ATP-dependent DNA helicase RecG [bacterium]|nr:ATP-dependent DNA helicase RecG [bacterium]
MERFEQIKQAIDVEVKHCYINIQGRTQSFAKFIYSKMREEYKNSKNPKWKILMEYFDHYGTESLIARKRAIKRLVRIIKDELNPKKKEIEENNLPKDPSATDVCYIKGIGPKMAYKLNKLGIFTANDLMYYFPRKHIDYSHIDKICNLQEGMTTTILGYIKSTQAFNSKSGLGICKVKIQDETGSVNLNFFMAKAGRHLLERVKSQFPKNSAIMVSGIVKMNSYDGKLTIDKPTYNIIETLDDENNSLNMGRIVPIYALSETLNIKTMRKAMFNCLELFKNSINNVVPEYLIKKHNLLNKKDAMSEIHFPQSMEMLERARFSLVFEELFIIQLKMLEQREKTKKELATVPLKIKENGLVMNFIKSLPFELTSAQKHAVNEILNDLTKEEPMQRLLQGDVGSGKTVVATIFLLAGVESGYQGAIMAPTEILARQHYNNLVEWLTPMGLKVGLFLGSSGKKMRSAMEKDLFNGQMHIAVGTHALIQDNVEFNNLGAIVIDEQHRFGVKQRSKLTKKSLAPQTLTMTATPIPRTLAFTLHGDLDLTIIDEMPVGRKPIKTYLKTNHREIYSLIKEEIKNGHQAYIVYPLIEESETLSAKAATKEAERLQETVFSDYKVGLLHGKLKNDEKEEVMQKFKNNEYDILVSTTVVEVGVDVKNATVMVIENAERFGLSQLHQLRGRVGRSDLQSYCILSSSSKQPETLERLTVMEETNNGFVIAEKDLELRGPGDFLGVRQSGLPEFLIADIIRDTKTLELARYEAQNFIKDCNLEDYPALKSAEGLNSVDKDLLSA